MHERKSHGTDGGDPGPAVSDKKLTHLYETGHFHETAFGQIGHDDDGNDDLVGRKAQDKRHENHTIQSH